jgi:MFS family permease
MLGYMTLLYSLPNFADSIGLNGSQAAAISAYLNLGIALGRPAVGWASDRWGRIEIAGLLTGFCGLMCFAIWIPARTYGVTILFAILSGAVVGVFWMVSRTLKAKGCYAEGVARLLLRFLLRLRG